jgi:succinylglutamate desuccinylase
MDEHGFISLSFEGGKIGSHETVENHRVILWQLLYKAGCIPAHAIPQEAQEAAALKEFSSRLPRRLKLDYCHKIRPEDEFRMLPGFKNYDWIKRGDLLAHDRHGEIHSQYNGYMLMPLYQPEGNDGFFIISRAHELQIEDD